MNENPNKLENKEKVHLTIFSRQELIKEKKKKTHTKIDGGSIWDQFFNGVRPFLWKLSNEQPATITTHKSEQL